MLKRDALTRSVAAYEKMASYRVQQFATAATFEIADLYASLSRSLIESERPEGLSDMELEQYHKAISLQPTIAYSYLVDCLHVNACVLP